MSDPGFIQRYRFFQEAFERLEPLFAIDADLQTVVCDFLDWFARAADAEKACVVSFRADAEAAAFCHGGDGRCAGDCAVSFARRMSGVVPRMEEGRALLARMTAEEQDRFWFRDPVFFTVSREGKVYGALFCDRRSGWDAQMTAFVQGVCNVLASSFRNAAFYRSHLSQQTVLTRILENLDANIYVSDMQTDEILFINKKMREEFGLPDDCAGRLCWEVLQSGMEGRCDFCPAPKLADRSGGQIVWEEHNGVTGKYYRNTDSVIEWQDGRMAHLQHSVDITNEKRAHRGLEEARQVAENANQAKGDFLSRMSHEIRTPINAIIGMTRIAKASDSMEKTRNALDKIDLSSKQLLNVINDILDMSKISANKMSLSVGRFDFERMLIDIFNIISAWAGEKRQKLHVHMDMDMPRYYLGDEFRLSQVLTNLLSNAVKFTPQAGRIRVDIREKSRENNVSAVEVAVSDTGIGIAPQNREHLFSSFEQADGGIARQFGGTGLGLAICKSIVEMMGGEISVESTVGKGSTFTFTVRLEVARQEEEARSFGGMETANLRVLLIDDEEETREYFSQIMKEFKISARTAAGCDEGIAAIREAEKEGRPCNIVFVDWQMPGVDGIETLKRIKREFEDSVVIMVSAGEWKEAGAEAEANAAGAFRFLSKPLFPSLLMDTINEVVGVPRKQEGVLRGSRVSFAGYTILLVEDVEVNREIVCQDLADTGVKIDCAENGRIAVELFEKDPRKYDLILMDIHMDVMDGYEATRRIRALPVPRARAVPIIAMTANAFAEDVQKCLDAGMNDHLAKPIDLEKLFSRLSYYLAKYEEPAPIAPDTKKQAESEVQTAEMEKYINVEEALGRLRGNKTVYKTLLKSFAKNDSWSQLQAQVAENDMEAAAKSAHAIKGMAGNLSLTAVYNTVVLLEAQLKSGFAYEESFEKLKDDMAQTLSCAETLMETL